MKGHVNRRPATRSTGTHRNERMASGAVSMAGTLLCELPGFSASSCRHAVLVMTNCAVGNSPGPHQLPGGYRTNVDFTVRAELV